MAEVVEEVVGPGVVAEVVEEVVGPGVVAEVVGPVIDADPSKDGAGAGAASASTAGVTQSGDRNIAAAMTPLPLARNFRASRRSVPGTGSVASRSFDISILGLDGATRIPCRSMKEAYLTRDAGHVMVRSGEGLLLCSRQQRPALRLNRTAALTWLLCDGALQRGEIVDRIRGLYPDRAEEVLTEVPALLDELLADGRLRSLAVACERPVLRVSFRGLWKAFDPGDNYLTWMLSFRYDVLVIESGSIPDLCFFGTAAADDPDVTLDRDRTLTVFVGPAAVAAVTAADFALVHDGDDDEDRLRLPSWTFLAEWRRDLAGYPEAEHLAAYSPQRFGERFLAALEQHTGRQRRADAPSTDQPPVAGSQNRSQEDKPREDGPREDGPREDGPRLTVGMAVFDDYDGAYFTVQALVLTHPEIAAEMEILIIDNQPRGTSAAALERLAGAVSGGRYIAFGDYEGTSVRDAIFRYARAPIVLCLDSHVLLPPGTLRRLVDYMEARPDCDDLLQGPLLYDDQRTLSTHFDPIWSAGMFGVWGTDERGLAPEAPPFEVPMQGLGVFACRRRAWPGLNPRFRGFGGEEGYLHEKFRQRGARTLCLPFLRWVHRFERPGGIQFRNIWEERIRNYLIGHLELGLPTIALESHFREFLGDQVYLSAETAALAEMASPLWTFDAIYSVELANYDNHRRRFREDCERTGLGHLLRRAPSDCRPSSSMPARLRAAFAHRRIVERARRLELDSVLLIDVRTELNERTAKTLAAAAEALRQRPWEISIFASGDKEKAVGVAYHRRIYRRICDELPAEPEGLAITLREHGGSFVAYLESLTNDAA